jgi:hypothetical protein
MLLCMTRIGISSVPSCLGLRNYQAGPELKKNLKRHLKLDRLKKEAYRVFLDFDTTVVPPVQCCRAVAGRGLEDRLQRVAVQEVAGNKKGEFWVKAQFLRIIYIHTMVKIWLNYY